MPETVGSTRRAERGHGERKSEKSDEFHDCSIAVLQWWFCLVCEFGPKECDFVMSSRIYHDCQKGVTGRGDKERQRLDERQRARRGYFLYYTCHGLGALAAWKQ